MPGNKEQTGGDRARRGWLSRAGCWLRAPARCRARGGRARRAPASPGAVSSPRCHVPSRFNQSWKRPGSGRVTGAARRGARPRGGSRAPLRRLLASPGDAPGSGAGRGREGRVCVSPPRPETARRAGRDGRTHPGRTDGPRPAAHLLPPTHPRAGRGAEPAPRAGARSLPARSAPTFRPFPRREVRAGRGCRGSCRGSCRGLRGPAGTKARGRRAALTYVRVAEGLLRVDGRAAAGVGRAGPAEQQHRQPGQQAGQRGGHLAAGLRGSATRPRKPHPPPGPAEPPPESLGPAAAAPARRCGRCCGRSSAAFYGGVFFLPRLPLSLPF